MPYLSPIQSRETAAANLPALAEGPVHSALHLTGGGAKASIVLHEQIYTLRITRQGKLILTK